MCPLCFGSQIVPTRRDARNGTTHLSQVRVRALVVGAGEYKPPYQALDNALNDARSVADVLRNRLGADVLLLENPTKSQLAVSTLCFFHNSETHTIHASTESIKFQANHRSLRRMNSLGSPMSSVILSWTTDSWMTEAHRRDSSTVDGDTLRSNCPRIILRGSLHERTLFVRTQLDIRSSLLNDTRARA